MSHRTLTAAMVVTIVAAALPAQGRQLTIEQTVPVGAGAVNFYSGLPDWRWTADGRFIHSDFGGRRVWIDVQTLRAVRPAEATAESARRAAMVAALSVLDGVDGVTASEIAAAAPEVSDAMWALHDGDIYFHRSGEKARRLTAGGAPKAEVGLSPDGRYLAFVSDQHDLQLVATDSGALVARMDHGAAGVQTGVLDWIYQEELYERGDFRGYWWNSRSDAVVFYSLDERPVKDFTIVDQTSAGAAPVQLEVTKYPLPGGANPVAALGVWHVDRPEPVWLDTSAYDPDILIVRAGWTPAGDQVVLQLQNRTQTWLDLALADPRTGELTTLFRERGHPGWVNVLGEPRWLDDGSFLWLSERTGNKHIYHYDADGALRGVVTDGGWDVEEILDVDAATGVIWFSGYREGALELHAYSIHLDGTKLVKLTEDAGTHHITLSPDRSMFLDAFSSLARPPLLRLCGGDGTVMEVLQRGPIPSLERHGFVHRELLQIPARDGFLLDATILRPPGFDGKKCYPVLFDVYGGPNTPIVRNEWNRGADPFHQFLAQRGVFVVQINNRSASGRGQRYSAACYRNLGASALRDLEDAAAWLAAHPWIDGARIGISGWSFGGTMAAYALTHSDAFCLGIAGAGVYDWRLYDSIYTERYMSTPKDNPEGYRQSSCIAAAPDLHGHLLLLHGTVDDNVHLQNTLQFARALQQAGAEFEMMLYPQARHGVADPDQVLHLNRLMWRVIEQHLGGPR